MKHYDISMFKWDIILDNDGAIPQSKILPVQTRRKGVYERFADLPEKYVLFVENELK